MGRLAYASSFDRAHVAGFWTHRHPNAMVKAFPVCNDMLQMLGQTDNPQDQEDKGEYFLCRNSYGWMRGLGRGPCKMRYPLEMIECSGAATKCHGRGVSLHACGTFWHHSLPAFCKRWFDGITEVTVVSLVRAWKLTKSGVRSLLLAAMARLMAQRPVHDRTRRPRLCSRRFCRDAHPCAPAQPVPEFSRLQTSRRRRH